jgi:nucleoid-associated protein YgaU
MLGIPLGYVRINTSDPPLSVTALLSDQRPDVTSGYGGWNEVARPRRKPITSWVGQPALRLTLGILLDEFADGLSIERQIAQLERMGFPAGSNADPPQVRITATGSAIPYQDRIWVMDSIGFGDAEMNDFGNRTRQNMTLNLLEFVADVYVSPAVRRQAKAKSAKPKKGAAVKRTKIKAKSRTATRASRTTTTVTAFNGEDLLSIAARELGDASRWTEIAQLNGLRDPRAVVMGQEIRLP